MEESAKLLLIGIVSGLSLPEGVNQLSLEKARIFRNPAAPREMGGPPEMGANTAIYSGEGQERHFVREVATYLIESEIDAPGGQLGHTKIRGSGGVMTGVSPHEEGISLSTGTKPHSASSVAIPLGKIWNTPLLIQAQFEKAVLPLRFTTKARILVFPIGVLPSDSRQQVLNSGIPKSCPELLGADLEVKLSEGDCKTIESLCKKLAKADLAAFEVPISLFSRSFYEVDLAQRALGLIIAIESLLSGTAESIGYKLAFRASCLTAEENDRWETFRFMKKTYGYRSTLVHGKKRELAKAKHEVGQDIERIEHLVRKCLTLACLLEVEHPKLPSGRNVNMRDENSIDEYILTYCLTKKGTTPLESFPEIGELWQSVRPW